jgi:hypothetical protein
VRDGRPGRRLLAALGLGWSARLAFLGQRSTEPPVRPVAGTGGRNALASSGLRTLVRDALRGGAVRHRRGVDVAFAEQRGSQVRRRLLLALRRAGSAVAAW